MSFQLLEPAVCAQYGLEYLGTGRHRAVYRRGRWVYKIPIHEMGNFDNWNEARVFAKTNGKDFNGEYARCRALKNGWLVMEYIEPVPWQLAPAWADFIDCRQVGTNRRGVVVAYDYA